MISRECRPKLCLLWEGILHALTVLSFLCIHSSGPLSAREMLGIAVRRRPLFYRPYFFHTVRILCDLVCVLYVPTCRIRS